MMKSVSCVIRICAVTLLILYGIGCEYNPVGENEIDHLNSILGTISQWSPDSTLASDTAGTTPVVKQELHIVRLPSASESSPSPVATRSSSSLISASTGGTVNIRYNYTSDNGKTVNVKVVLTIPAKALNEDTFISVDMDKERLGFTFAPDGLVFNIPAELDVNVTGMDSNELTNYGSVTFNWWDPAQNGWTEKPVRSIISSVAAGTVDCSGAVIQHFSRYAFGR